MNGIHAVVLATGNDTRGQKQVHMHMPVVMNNIEVLRLGSLIKNVVA